ncbi:conserved exported hypothetical protein [Tenacibaculum sp. 190524A02b]|uniref:DUF4398 domain-containing protein n=1 Tax=Tenacibaculum vairaonense TaxID=3137860 RepID=A0ABM9PRJ8_9FLAO
MKKIKSLGFIALGALAFVFMSFSSASDDMYGDSYLVDKQGVEQVEGDKVAVLATALRFTARAARATVGYTRRAIAYTREVYRVNAPGLEQVLLTASTYVIANSVDKHSENYVKEKNKLKKQKIRQLG